MVREYFWLSPPPQRFFIVVINLKLIYFLFVIYLSESIIRMIVKTSKSGIFLDIFL